MFKRTTLLALGMLFAGNAAHAASFNCTAAILDYAFSVTGNLSGGKLSGPAVIYVTKGGSPLNRAALAVSQSQFADKQSLAFDAAYPHAKIQVNTRYQGGTYNGTLAIQSDQGNTNLGTVCKVQ